MTTVLSIDIGGTKLAAGLVAEDGRVLVRRQVPTPSAGVWEALAGLVGAVVAEAGPSAGSGSASGGVSAGSVSVSVCGVGSGGPMTAGGEEVSPLNIPEWRGFPLRARLAALLDVPVFVDNDAKAMALGEGWVGAAAGCPAFVGMVVSTGVGGGIVLDGRLLDGAEGNAGHIGHVIVAPDGRVCECGAQGCLEAEASGTAIEAATGRPPAEAGPEVVARTGTLVGRAVASVCNLLDLRLAVVGGGVALGFGAPFFEAAKAELDRRCRLDFSRGARVVPAALGGDAGLVGAAVVALRGMGGGFPPIRSADAGV